MLGTSRDPRGALPVGDSPSLATPPVGCPLVWATWAGLPSVHRPRLAGSQPPQVSGPGISGELCLVAKGAAPTVTLGPASLQLQVGWSPGGHSNLSWWCGGVVSLARTRLEGSRPPGPDPASLAPNRGQGLSKPHLAQTSGSGALPIWGHCPPRKAGTQPASDGKGREVRVPDSLFVAQILSPSRHLSVAEAASGRVASGQGSPGRKALLRHQTPPPPLLGDTSSRVTGKVTSRPLRPASQPGLHFMILL